MRTSLLTFALFLCALVALQAQPLNKATYAAMLKTAEEQLANNDYYNAIEWYEKAYEERSDPELAITIATLHYNLRNYRRAESWFRRALRKDKKGKYAEYRFMYARCMKMNEKYDEAIEEFQKYLETAADEKMRELAENEIAGAEFAKIAPEPEDLTISNAGRKINSKYSEYSPAFSPDGTEMYYATLKRDELLVIDADKGDKEEYYTRIYVAKRTDEGWSEPQPLGQNINRPGYHVSNCALSADGRRMFFNRLLLKGNEVAEAKLFVSEKSGSGWGAAKEIESLNGDYIAKQPAVGELFGKEVLFFSSNMDGGEGGFDLYYATYKGNGVYGDPVNLGPKINTPGNEETPFFLDGILYFSSDGHPTMGGFDIFRAEWNGATWSEPSNMGKGYNTSLDDHYFTLAGNGFQGALTSNRTGVRSVFARTCCDDIYNVTLKLIEANLLTLALDAETEEPLDSVTVELVALTAEKPKVIARQTHVKTDPFAFPLELDQTYMIIANRAAYDPDTLEFNTLGLLDSKTFELKLRLNPEPVYITLTKETPIVLENIYYDFDDDKILPDAEQDLQLVFELMNEYPDMVIELSSHTDNRGTEAYNRDLSQRRAESARRWLINKGIARRRIEAVGYGESVPFTVTAKIAAEYPFLKEGDVLTEEFINKLETEEQKEIAHQLNRRTEFKIIEGPSSIRIEERRLIRRGKHEVKDQPVEKKKEGVREEDPNQKKK